jgi:hypothetical protein
MITSNNSITASELFSPSLLPVPIPKHNTKLVTANKKCTHAFKTQTTDPNAHMLHIKVCAHKACTIPCSLVKASLHASTLGVEVQYWGTAVYSAYVRKLTG